MTDQTLAKLREILLNEFSEAELVSLCKDIGLNYDALPGAGMFGKTREIVEAARSQDKLRALQARVRELRPQAYEAAGIGMASAAGAAATVPTATTTTATPSPAAEAAPVRKSSGGGGFPIQWLAIGLAILLCAVVALTLLLPRPSSSPANTAGSSNTSATSAVATALPTNPTTNAGAIQPDQTATALGPQETVDSKGVEGLELTPGASAGQGSSNATVEALATSAAIENATAAAATSATVTPSVNKATSADSTTPTAASVAGASVAESQTEATQAIRGLNDQLLGFYSGSVPTGDLQQYWRGTALRQVSSFGDIRLPRILRLGRSLRNSIGTTYEYLKPPTVVKGEGNTATVTAREYWRYNNQVNGVTACETRDYTYYLVKDGESYKVNQFTGKLLSSSCNS